MSSVYAIHVLGINSVLYIHSFGLLQTCLASYNDECYTTLREKDRGDPRRGRIVCARGHWNKCAGVTPYIVVPNFADQPGRRAHPFTRASCEILETIFSYNASSSRSVKLTLQLPTVGSLAESFVDIAVRYSELWQHATLYLSSDLQKRLQDVANRLPRLQSLNLKIEEPRFDIYNFHYWTTELRGESETWFLGTAFKNATLLRTLYIQVTTPADPFALNLPWSQIHHFTLITNSQASPLAFGPMYQKMPNLTSFEGWSAFKVLPNQPLKLEKFRALDLCDFPDILDWVILPGLRQITNLRFSNIDRVGALIQRSGCTITMASISSIHHRDVTQDQLATFLKSVPKLKSLVVSLMPDADVLLQGLQSTSNALPQLEELTLALDTKDINKLVYELVKRPSPLKRLIFHEWVYEGENGNAKDAEGSYQELRREFGDKVDIGPMPSFRPLRKLDPWSLLRGRREDSD